MSAEYVGSLTIGGCFPTAATAQAGLDAAIGVSRPSIQAQVDGIIAAQARLGVSGPSIAAQLAIAQEIVAGLQLGLPSASLQATGLAALLASLQLQLASLNAQFAFSAALAITLGSAGVHMYVADSTSGNLASDLSTVIGAGLPGAQSTDQSFGVLVASHSPITITQLKSFTGQT